MRDYVNNLSKAFIEITKNQGTEYIKANPDTDSHELISGSMYALAKALGTTIASHHNLGGSRLADLTQFTRAMIDYAYGEFETDDERDKHFREVARHLPLAVKHDNKGVLHVVKEEATEEMGVAHEQK